MVGEVQWGVGFVLLAANALGIWIAIRLLSRNAALFPFLI